MSENKKNDTVENNSASEGSEGGPSLDSQGTSLLDHARREGKKGLPPVHLWHPQNCGEIDIFVARNGDWFYQGTPFTRPALVRLFSTILRKDDDGYYLVTPVEKMKIRVEDAPFVITSVESQPIPGGVQLVMETNTCEQLVVGPENPLWVDIDEQSGEPSPYVMVRNGLHALISRPVFYQLVELAEERDLEQGPCLGVESQGAFFVLGSSD